ncbi:MAG: hypothetical protein AAFY15_00105, partial [Cyanobacteria bacterium J06648_11]
TPQSAVSRRPTSWPIRLGPMGPSLIGQEVGRRETADCGVRSDGVVVGLPVFVERHTFKEPQATDDGCGDHESDDHPLRQSVKNVAYQDRPR